MGTVPSPSLTVPLKEWYQQGNTRFASSDLCTVFI